MSLRSRTTALRPLFIIILLAVAVRLAVALYLGDTVPPAKDELSYSALASRLATGHGFTFPEPWYPFTPADAPTAHWSFLYTAFVAGIYAITGAHPLAVRMAGAILGGILIPWLIFRLARRVWPARPTLALVGAALGAVYAYFALYAAMLMTETFYVAAVLWSLERASALVNIYRNQERVSTGLLISFGVSLGLAALLRQSILPWFVVLFAWLLWTGFRADAFRRAFLSLLGSGLILLAFILPFTIRNVIVYGDFLLLNSNAGYAMYSAQHPLHGASFQAFAAASLPEDIEPSAMNEASWDRELLRRGFGFIVEDPGRYALLSLSRIADYFVFWPSRDTSLVNNAGRVLSFGLFLPIMLYGLWLSRRDWRRYTLLYGFMLFYTVLHLLTWSMVRYRLPVDAVLLLFAALGLVDLYNRLRVRAITREDALTLERPHA